MKKLGIVALIAVALVLGVAGLAFAQDPTPAEPVPPVDGLCPYGGACGGYGMGGWGGYANPMYGLLAEALGMTAEAFDAALAEGQTLAEIAATQGVEMADLVAALVAPSLERLEQAVADGVLTQEQADEMIAHMSDMMAWRLENIGLGYGGYGGCGMRGGGWGGRHGGFRGGMRGGWGGGTSAPRYPNWNAPSNGL